MNTRLPMLGKGQNCAILLAKMVRSVVCVSCCRNPTLTAYQQDVLANLKNSPQPTAGDPEVVALEDLASETMEDLSKLRPIQPAEAWEQNERDGRLPKNSSLVYIWKSRIVWLSANEILVLSIPAYLTSGQWILGGFESRRQELFDSC